VIAKRVDRVRPPVWIVAHEGYWAVAKTYHLTPLRRLANVLMRLLLRVGLAPRTTMLLTVPGRRSGTPRSTPVTLVEEDGQRWLVAPYGPVGWVHNARAAGQVELSRGRRSETVRVRELGPEAAAPILKAYVERVPITRPYFDAAPDAPLAAFAAEASRHPVFQVVHSPR
jgi:deazaflavin-dependent oxidoreductase (nitroreductase family)